MAGAVKKATGLTGLAVSRDPHRTLTVLYDKILRTIQKMPEDTTYRKTTHDVISSRLGVVKSEPSVSKLEEKLAGGQVEELIIQAENELSLARKMLQWRAWEPLVEQPPKNQWRWPI